MKDLNYYIDTLIKTMEEWNEQQPPGEKEYLESLIPRIEKIRSEEGRENQTAAFWSFAHNMVERRDPNLNQYAMEDIIRLEGFIKGLDGSNKE